MLRLFKIFWVIIRFRLDKLLTGWRYPWYLRLLSLCFPFWLLFRARHSDARRLRLALESLGPVFVKFGQVLSTRRDLLPKAMADELAFLQDRVKPFATAQAVATIEQALGGSVDQLFARFDKTPLASASIAQVHSAQLASGAEVVIKVIRPGIERTIRHDVGLLKGVARLVRRLPEGQRLRPLEVVQEFERTTLDELDLLREGANTALLRRNAQRDNKLYVPDVYWELTRKSVLVLERIYGTPISDLATLKARGTNLKLLAERGVEIFFSQVFGDSFFHADMHPGNIFVDLTDPAQPSYIGIDCGIVGSLSRQDQSYLAQNLLAFFNRDYYRVAELHVESGWVPAATRVDEFEAAIRSVCEPIFEKPINEISFGILLIRLFQTAQRFDMSVQPQLVLLQKTLLNVEGLGRELYPQLDLWHTAKPFLEKWLQQQISPKRFIDVLKQQGPGWLAKAPRLPDLLFDALQKHAHDSGEQQHYQRLIELNRTEGRKTRTLIRRLAAASGLAIVAWQISGTDWHSQLTIAQTGVALVMVMLLLWP